ncbi:hypothetical protein BCR41DRAFT_363741, partial [Lobosporangium transversale]
MPWLMVKPASLQQVVLPAQVPLALCLPHPALPLPLPQSLMPLVLLAHLALVRPLVLAPLSPLTNQALPPIPSRHLSRSSVWLPLLSWPLLLLS